MIEAELEAHNADVAWLTDIERDTPARMWWHADFDHPAIAGAFSIKRSEEGAVYALAPFRIASVNGRLMIIAAYPAPRILGPVDTDWLNIEAIIAWNPNTDEAHIIGDAQPQMVGDLTHEPTIYASPRAFFFEWLKRRAAFYVRWSMAKGGKWKHGHTERDIVPGGLVIGDPADVRWRPSTMPENVTCIGLDARRIRGALIRAAHVPRITTFEPEEA